LGPLLSHLRIDVEVTPELPEFDQVSELMIADFGGPWVDAPGLLHGDVDLPRIRAFAVGAAEFHAARPWLMLGPGDRIEVESPVPSPEFSSFSLMGSYNIPSGLAFVEPEETRRRRQGAGAPEWVVRLGTLGMLPLRDADLWVAENLPVAAPDAYPAAISLTEPEHERPDAALLAYLEALLRALAATTEDDLDAGRWERRVQTAAGEQSVIFAIPSLLEPVLPGREANRPERAPDRRAMERTLADVRRLIEEKRITSVDDANRFLREQVLGRPIPHRVGGTTIEQAQDLVYQAFEATGRRRIQLARKALAICPDCADAFVIQGEAREEQEDYECALELYELGIAAGRRALGDDRLTSTDGLWVDIECRPYLRAIEGAARALEELARLDEAIERWREILRLNPGDNQGARYPLLRLLLETRQDEKASEHVEANAAEPMMIWGWAHALLAFRKRWDDPVSREALGAALRRSATVGRFLLRDEPAEEESDRFTPGTEEEAISCANTIRKAWIGTPGVLDWLKARMKERRAANRESRAKRIGKGTVGKRPRKH
jgi:tetratricopeptide (TPR) repeat protein